MNKTLVFNDVEMTKKDFYDAKKAIPLNLVDRNNIVVSNKVKNNNEISKYFIDYLNDIDDVSPLCSILPQMDSYIKYFKNGGKNMSFKIEDEEVCIKYNQIWNKIKELLGVKFYRGKVLKFYHEDKYIKTKVKTSNTVINTLFSGDEIPKERVHYTCISCISIDSVLRVNKKNYPQVYLEQCNYKMKKRELKSFTDYEVDIDYSLINLIIIDD